MASEPWETVRSELGFTGADEAQIKRIKLEQLQAVAAQRFADALNAIEGANLALLMLAAEDGLSGGYRLCHRGRSAGWVTAHTVVYDEEEQEWVTAQ